MKLKFAAILAAVPLFACGVGQDEDIDALTGMGTSQDELLLGYDAAPDQVDAKTPADAGSAEEYQQFTLPTRRDPVAIPQDPIPAKDKRPLGPRPPCEDVRTNVAIFR